MWIDERNKLGLRVKDKYIREKMKIIRDNELSMDDSTENKDLLRQFKCSEMWLERFKKRYRLVSRRETSCRTLPTNFREISRDFIKKVATTIVEKKISPDKIFNFDQVPRYVEMGSGATITRKGTKNVTLRKSSTSHKRFTYTPIVSASGKFVSHHVLFSNLKNRPTVNPNVYVDVNKTGMWSTAILKDFLDNHLLDRIQSCFREPVLIILDSYGAHCKLISGDVREKYERRNVHFEFIPPNLTGLLQPLDVCLNRSFQQFFNDCYTDHVNAALRDTENRTARGNIRMPSYMDLSTWCHTWGTTISPNMITKAFKCCGIVHPTHFNIDELHGPLKECFSEIDDDSWLASYGDSLNEEVLTEFVEVGKDFYEVIFNAIDGEDYDSFEGWKSLMMEQIITLLNEDADTCALMGNDEKEHIRQGVSTGTNLEWFAMAKLLKFDIKITQDGESLVFMGADNTEDDIHVYTEEGVFYLHVNNYH